MQEDKLKKIEFRGYHSETLHNNSDAIKELTQRLYDLEYLHERGMVSRQLITLNVITTTIGVILSVSWFVWKLSEGM